MQSQTLYRVFVDTPAFNCHMHRLDLWLRKTAGLKQAIGEFYLGNTFRSWCCDLFYSRLQGSPIALDPASNIVETLENNLEFAATSLFYPGLKSGEARYLKVQSNTNIQPVLQYGTIYVHAQSQLSLHPLHRLYLNSTPSFSTSCCRNFSCSSFVSSLVKVRSRLR